MATGQSDIQSLLQQLSGVQTTAQGSVPSAVNNGNPNTVYNNAMPAGTQNNPWVQYNPVSGSGGYLPPATNALGQWLINPGPTPAAGSGIDWSQMIQDIAGPMLPTWNPQAPLPTARPPVKTPVPVNPPVNTGGPNPPIQGPTIKTPILPDGSETGFGCVVLESFVDGKDGRAGTIKKRDLMVTIDPRNMVKGVDVVTYAATKPMPCVRIRTESGIELECSTTAPIADSKGNQVLAPNLKGVAILVVDNDEPRVESVIEIEDIGNRLVRHITCGNKFFLAGKTKGKYVLHHNMKKGDQSNHYYMKDGLDPDWLYSYGGTDSTKTKSGEPDPFSAEGAAALTGLNNPLMANSMINQLGASMQTMGFGTSQQALANMSTSDAAAVVKANEGLFSSIFEKAKINVKQGLNYITQNPVPALLTFFFGGGPIALIGKMGQAAIRTPDK